MIEKLSQSRSMQLLLIAALILIVPLAADINRRITVIRRMRQEETRLQDEIAQAWAENEALKAQLASVTAPAFLEKWARVEGRMTLPGEVALIPISLPPKRGPQSTQDASGAFVAEPSSIPEQWHRLFFQVPSNE